MKKPNCCDKCYELIQSQGFQQYHHCKDNECECHIPMSYERDHSHLHCYADQEGHEKHLACCICLKQNPANNTEDWLERFDKAFTTEKSDKTQSGLQLNCDPNYAKAFIAQERALAVKEVVEGIVKSSREIKWYSGSQDYNNGFFAAYKRFVAIARSFIPKEE